MNKLDDFIGKVKRLQQAGKKANLVLNTLAGSVRATLSVRIGPGGPGQQTHQQKARGARNGPAQQKRREKRASARATATAGAAANGDATAKEGPKERVDNAVESYAGKARVSPAGMRSGEGSKAGMSASTTLTSTKSSKVPNTTGTTFHIAAKAVVQTQTKTDLEPTLSRQHPVAMVEVTTDRLRSADKTKTKLVDCAVQVVVKTANKSVNAHQEFANFRYDKQTQATDDNNCLPDEEEAKFERDGRELGWFMPDPLIWNRYSSASHHTRKIIISKLQAEKYASAPVRSPKNGLRLPPSERKNCTYGSSKCATVPQLRAVFAFNK